MSHTIRHICTAHGRRAGKSVVVALMTLACSMAAWAVEFGAVTVNSQQGQPLNADVVLVDLPVPSAADIAVTATDASEWPGLTAAARSKPDGVIYVHIESTKPVDKSELTLQFDIRYPTTPVTNGVALVATLQRSVTLTIPAATSAVQSPQVQGPASLDVVRGTTASEIVYERL
ncbi:MAG: type IV pilus assembly protein FimV, partial [Burkholderiaceae bacterium]